MRLTPNGVRQLGYITLSQERLEGARRTPMEPEGPKKACRNYFNEGAIV